MATEQHRYAYDRSFPGHLAKKFRCPSCSHKRYVRFYDFETNEYLPEEFGKCDREDHCAYVQTPWEWLKAKGQGDAESYVFRPVATKGPAKSIVIEYVDPHILQGTLRAYEANNFTLYLETIFDHDTVVNLIYKYFIGTAKNNGTIFWQIDKNFKIRTGQKIHYKTDGHRDKSFNPPSQRLFTIDKGYVPCLFGENLIKSAPSNAMFAIVEAEKTAIIASVYYPEYQGRPLVWLACCGMHGMTAEKFEVLRGLDVLLVPDFAFTARATWGLVPMRKKLNELTGKIEVNPEGELDLEYVPVNKKLSAMGCDVAFFDPMPEVEDGSDIADYVILFDVPVYYERPQFDTFYLENVVQESSNPEMGTPEPQKLDFNKIGQSVAERDKNDQDRASQLIYQRYGYGVSGAKFDKLHHELAGQLRLLADPRVQSLISKFDLLTELKY